MTPSVKLQTLFIGLALLCLLAVWLSLALGPVSLPLLDTLQGGAEIDGVADSTPGAGAGW